MALLLGGLWFELTLLVKVAIYFIMISTLDYAPNVLRRKILQGEYKGDALCVLARPAVLCTWLTPVPWLTAVAATPRRQGGAAEDADRRRLVHGQGPLPHVSHQPPAGARRR